MIGGVAAAARAGRGSSGAGLDDDGGSMLYYTDRQVAIDKQQEFLDNLVCLMAA